MPGWSFSIQNWNFTNQAQSRKLSQKLSVSSEINQIEDIFPFMIKCKSVSVGVVSLQCVVFSILYLQFYNGLKIQLVEFRIIMMTQTLDVYMAYFRNDVFST